MRLVTPVSDLFADSNAAAQIQAASDTLEARPERMSDRCSLSKRVSHIHFSDPTLDLNLPWTLEGRRYLARTLEHFSDADFATFHVSRDYENVSLDDRHRYVPIGPGMRRSEMLRNLSVNAEWIAREFDYISVGIENVNYYATGAYEISTDPGFISEAVECTGAMFLFDLAHAAVSAGNLGVPLEDYASGLPWHALAQVHLSRSRVRPGGEFFDAHEIPDLSDLETLQALEIYPEANLPLTVEYYGSAQALVTLLHNLQAI